MIPASGGMHQSHRKIFAIAPTILEHAGHRPLLGCPLDGRPAPELIRGFFQCISSDGTLKWNPATIHHDLINCRQNTRLNSVILGPSLENSHGRLYKKIRKKRTYNYAEKP